MPENDVIAESTGPLSPQQPESEQSYGTGRGSLSTEAGDLGCDDAHVLSILHKMNQINQANEMDARSATSGSRQSADSSRSDEGSDPPADRKSSDEPKPHQNGLTTNTSALTNGTNGHHQSSPGSSGAEQSNQLDEDEETDLWAVWGSLVKNWNVELKKRPQYIREMCRRGIPCHFRTIAWQLLSGANTDTVREQYAEFMRTPSPYEKVIKRDINRTYPELDFFKEGGKGQASLFNVMKAYSLHDREVGYCQGQAFVAGLLLLQMPEEEAFSVMLKICYEYRLREIYKPAMTELGLCMFQLECLVQEQLPDLFQHFNNMGFDTSMYASSWFITLFTTHMPLDVSNRIMDAFLSEGMEIVFRLALAILQQCRVDLLQLDMEGMLKYFQRDMAERFENDPEILFTSAYKVTMNTKRMKRLEKDYMVKKTKEQEEAVELRRLRTECRLLRGRVEHLEQESEHLADRLIKGQVDLAQEAEFKMSLKHELLKHRDINLDAHKRLEDAYDTIRELTNKTADGLAETGTQVDDTSMVEHIHSLQSQLIETSAREADNEICIRELKQRVQELEIANKRLKETPPSHCVASIQEELISVKMREAEATLSLKEMRQRLGELDQQWTDYMAARLELDGGSGPSSPSSSRTNVVVGPPSGASQQQQQHSPNSIPEGSVSEGETSAPTNFASASVDPTNNEPISRRFSLMESISRRVPSLGSFSSSMPGNASGDNGPPKPTVRDLEDQLMGVRIREADTFAELKEMRQKVMELETQNHVCTNQLRRQDDDSKALRAELLDSQERERKSEQQLREVQHKCMQAEGRLKEAQVMARLQISELTSQIDQLREQRAEQDSKRQEKWTKSQLGVSNSDASEPDSDSLGTPVSLMSRSITTSHDRLSITSETSSADAFNLADLAVKVPADLLQEDLQNGPDSMISENLTLNQTDTSDTDTPDKFGGN